LESKEFCLWVVSDSELITVEEAKGALEQAVPDLDRHLANESIEILNIVLTISDNGRGITADQKSERLSLGLLGRRERVNLIGGTIDITVVEGKGTEITVRVSMIREG
jgi:two-component system sensor histidine kinase DegS